MIVWLIVNLIVLLCVDIPPLYYFLTHLFLGDFQNGDQNGTRMVLIMVFGVLRGTISLEDTPPSSQGDTLLPFSE